MKRIVTLLLILSCHLAFGQTKNVLFIGNSYTFFNEMPSIVANLASSGGATLNWQSSAEPGYTLQQHAAANSTAIGLIKTGGWDYVILQEFSQYPSEPLSVVEAEVFPYASYLHSLVNSYNSNARTMFYMTWGRKNGDAERCARLPEVCTYEGMDDLTRQRYMIMAMDNQAEVSPVGPVWRYIRQNYPSIELYNADGHHPSEAGSYAAACCFYAVIFRKDPSLLTYNYTLTPADAANIRNAAKVVAFNNLSNWYIGAYDIPDTQAPTTPTGLYASNVQQTSLTLNWTAATDNVGIAAYIVYQNGVQVSNGRTTSANITGLSPLTTYTFTVRARDASGNISPASTALNVTTADTEAPTVPTGLSSGNLSETGFTLSWTASTDNVGVTGYDIFQNGTKVTTVTGTTAGITGLSASTIYAMTVKAKDAAGNSSSASTIFNVTTPDTHAPTIPAGLNSSNITQTSFTLNWTVSTDNVGVIGYEVYRNGIFLETVTSNTLGISGLSAGTTYAMTVKAKDAADNNSAHSAVLNVTTLDPVIIDTQAPTIPTGLVSSNITQTSFTLSWTASTDNMGVTGYIVYKNGVQESTVSSTSASITGLNASITYAYTVKAKDAAGNLSAASNDLNVTTPDTDAPTAPTGLTSGNLSETTFTLSWIASADNVSIAGYDVYLNGVKVTSVAGTSANISGLSAFTTYAMTVKAKDAAGNISGASLVLNVTTTDTHAPSAPTGLLSDNITQTSFTLNWTASSDNVAVTGYDVYQNGTKISTVTGTTANITGLSASTTYAMTVRAKDAAGNVSISGTALNVTTLNIVVIDTQAPTVPSGLVSANISQTSFTLSWSASTDNVGVTGYDVYQNGLFVATVLTTTTNLSGLTGSTTYTMTVRAKDAAGNNSGLSLPLNATTLEVVIPDNEKPTVPTGLTSGNITEDSFTLSWTASSDNIGVVGYDVYRNGAHVTTVTATTATLTSLAASTTYSMTVIAKDAAGNLSDPSSGLSVTTLNIVVPDTQAPTVPSGLSSTSVTETGFTLNWSASIDDVGVTGYDVYKNGALLNTVTNPTLNITGLIAGTTYAMTVRAKDAAGNISAASNTFYVLTADFQAPTIPTGLTSASVTETSFVLIWTASTDNVSIAGYDVYRNGVFLNSVTNPTISITSLNASTTYSMTVKAKDAAGNISAPSSILNVTTSDLQAPTVPAGLSSANVNETSFTLNWNASTDNVGVTGYDVYRNGSLLNFVTNNSMNISGLNAGTTYVMTVRAKDAANNTSVSSNALNITTADFQAPGTPTGLTGSNLTQTSFTLSWTASSDNVGVTGYNVYKNGVLLKTVTGISATIDGLSASTSYPMSVKATDAAGNISSSSSILVVTTPDTQAPTAPTGLISSNISQSSFTLSWTASSDNVGVTGYDVYRNGVFLTAVTGTTVGISGLSAYTSYQMTVRAKDAADNVSAASTILNVTTLDNQPPTTPTGLYTSNLTQSGFQLYWTASTDNVGVTGYYVYQDGTQIATVATNNATITGLKASTGYVMTVRARDAAANLSTISTPLTVTTPDTEAPTVPSGLKYADLSQTGFTLTWSASTDNVDVTGYNVYCNGILVTFVGGRAAGITDLLAFRTYAITVKAKDAAGNISAASAVLNVTTPDTESPTAPTGLTYTNLTQSGFTLNWTASIDNVGVSEYQIFHEGVLMKTVTTTNAVLTGLIASKTYTLIVRAKDAAGNLSVPSSVISITTPDTQAPTSPTGLLYTNLTQSGFTLKWTASTDNVRVTGYDIYQNGTQVMHVTGTDTLVTGLLASKTYAMTVKAKDAAGNISGASAILNVTTPDTEVPTTPIGLSYTNLTQSSFTLSWAASTDNVGVTGYQIFQADVLLKTVITTDVILTGLIASKTYPLTVRAKDAAGNLSVPSDVIIITTPDTEAPTPPTGLLYTHLTQSGFALKWTASSDNVGVTEYEVYRNGMLLMKVFGTDTVLTGLSASTIYAMTVKAKDAAGNISTASDELSITTPDTEAPTVPVALTSKSVSETSFTLNWKASTDNVSVTGYEVYKNGELVDVFSDTTAEIIDLTAYKTYSMTIKAKDAAGNISAFSNVLNVQTMDMHAPSKPTGLIASHISDSTFTMSWIPSEDNIGVAVYEILNNNAPAATTMDTVIYFNNLAAFTKCVLSVIAIDSAGNASEASANLLVITTDTQAPSVPTDLSSVSITNNSLNMLWKASRDNVDVIGYNVYQDGTLVSFRTDTTAYITGLHPVTSYNITVRAVDEAGNLSDPSNPLQVETVYRSPNELSVIVYPNPYSGNELHIDFGKEDNKETTIELIDNVGNVVYQRNISGTDYEYIISGCNLNDGLYIIKIKKGDAFTCQRLVVLNQY
jgi:chitodextrinase